eukprot:scaffold167536_cov28-Tisochrysis_lutea.AAC.5
MPLLNVGRATRDCGQSCPLVLLAFRAIQTALTGWLGGWPCERVRQGRQASIEQVAPQPHREGN